MSRFTRLYVLLIFAACILCGCGDRVNTYVKPVVSSDSHYQAWWLKTKFIPVHKKIRGIPVSRIDPSWRLASELDVKAFPKEPPFGDVEEDMRQSGYSFSRLGDFNRDGIEDLALVGIYENKAGERGGFILILSKDKSGGWQKTFVTRLSGPVFNCLSERETLETWACFDCDYGAQVIWDKEKKTYYFKPFEEEEEGEIEKSIQQGSLR